MSLLLAINKKLEQLFPEMVRWRRYLHANPELSFQEQKTANFIQAQLEPLGLTIRRAAGCHGIIADLRGGKEGPIVAFRADIDALPIQDEKTCAYASKIKGVMHACGHDAHTASLLALATILSNPEIKAEIPGTVRFIFQPAEELTPGGALTMIADGTLQGVSAIYGVHLWTPFPVGNVYCAKGPIMAAADEFVIEISGKGGHGGLPHDTIDSIIVGAYLAVNLQTIVSRNINPTSPSVLSIGSFHAGNSFNAIAEKCVLKGTVRTFDLPTRDLIKQRMEEITIQTCAMFGAKGELVYKLGYPPVTNHEKEAERFTKVAELVFGKERVKPLPLIMAAEDFTYYLQRVPGCFMLVGAGNAEQGIQYPHHHPQFDIDEAAMKNSVRLLAQMGLDYLREASTKAQ